MRKQETDLTPEIKRLIQEAVDTALEQRSKAEIEPLPVEPSKGPSEEVLIKELHTTMDLSKWFSGLATISVVGTASLYEKIPRGISQTILFASPLLALLSISFGASVLIHGMLRESQIYRLEKPEHSRYILVAFVLQYLCVILSLVAVVGVTALLAFDKPVATPIPKPEIAKPATK